jgi:hypothetical protein
MAEVGEVITIKINGRPIDTTIDVDGRQRLPERPIIRYLMHRAGMDFNELGTLAMIGMVPPDDRRFIYQNIGYTLNGYKELFPGDDIENPLRDDTDDTASSE